MPPFRQRPITYLFLGASTALIFALASPSSGIATRVGTQSLVIGQIMVSGAWFVLGSMHRLARGAVLLGATAGLAAVAMAIQRGLTLNSWQRALAGVFMIQLVVAVATGLTLIALRKLSRDNDGANADALRYAVVEIFGWTIVVALASLLLRNADFLHLFRQWRSVIWLLGCCLAGTIAAALHRPNAGNARIAAVLPVAMACLAGGVIAPREANQYDLVQLTVATGYLVVYCFCRSLDETLKQPLQEYEEDELSRE